nr:5557_t:CDS:10 [Entrophospora candida]
MASLINHNYTTSYFKSVEAPKNIPFPQYYDVVMDWKFPLTVAAIYAIVITLLNPKPQSTSLNKNINSYNVSRAVAQSKGLKVSNIKQSGQFMTAIVFIHNLILCLYSLITFVSMGSTFVNNFYDHRNNLMDAYCDRDGSLWEEGLGYWGYLFYLSKYYEIIDTIIILMKGRRSSFLQTYHHADEKKTSTLIKETLETERFNDIGNNIISPIEIMIDVKKEFSNGVKEVVITTATTAPLTHIMFAGGFGGSTADFLMHSVDTVKTRLQGQKFTKPPKYQNMLHAYVTILKQEGIMRGLYGGVLPAISGSVPATTIYFGTYEFFKRNLTGIGIPDTISHLSSGALGDVVASTVYVPSEVLKTRLQLQGRYNNPHFFCGYNYRNTWHAVQMIYKLEGASAFYHGYRATLLRDVPFSALQFAFYEKFKFWAVLYTSKNNYSSSSSSSTTSQLTLKWEIITGTLAGALAAATSTSTTTPNPNPNLSSTISTPSASAIKTSSTVINPPTSSIPKYATHFYGGIWEGMQWNYKHHGLAGLFRGVAPRVAWTGMQSGLMFVIYEQVLCFLGNMATTSI